MSKRRKTVVLPESENEFLSSVLYALRKRSKALKNSSSVLRCDRVFVERDDDRYEKLELELRPEHSGAKRCPLNAHALEVPVVAVSLAEWKNNTWDWQWSYGGTLLPIYDGFTFVVALEATLDTSFGMDAHRTDAFDSIWSPLLARGPELVS